MEDRRECQRIPSSGRIGLRLASIGVVCTTNITQHSDMKPPTCGKLGTLAKHTPLRVVYMPAAIDAAVQCRVWVAAKDTVVVVCNARHIIVRVCVYV